MLTEAGFLLINSPVTVKPFSHIILAINVNFVVFLTLSPTDGYRADISHCKWSHAQIRCVCCLSHLLTHLPPTERIFSHTLLGILGLYADWKCCLYDLVPVFPTCHSCILPPTDTLSTLQPR